MTTAVLLVTVLLIAAASPCNGFAPHHARGAVPRTSLTAEESDGKTPSDPIDAEVLSDPEQLSDEQVGNLVADEEWAGLSMELADVVRTAVVEDIKKNSREFLGKEEYAVGDFSKEIDKRVKDEVAKIREKDEYELGDLSVVLDGKVKEMVCDLSGKDDYEFGDLSVEIDKRVKNRVAQFCGKENYQFGDVTKAALKKFSGKDDYQFGDITKNLMG